MAKADTVGEILERTAAPRSKLLDLPVHAPGIYFGMPEEEYHRDPSMSASGVKDIHVTPLTFWIRSGFNPNQPDDSTEAKEVGTAFHARLLEGPKAFAERYAVAPEIDDYPDAIDGGKALQARCRELGLKVSGTIPELCERIREADPDAVLWPDIIAKFEAEHSDRTIIKRKLASEIERHVRIVEMHPGTEKALRGGYCEVAIFYRDRETGVPMKGKIDYLKVRAGVELKTFTNPFGKEIGQAIGSSMANNKYVVDAVVRLDAIEHAKALYRQHGDAIVHGEAPPKEWLEAFAQPAPHAFVFLFLEKGHVPNVVVREFKQRETAKGEENLYWQRGHAMFRRGVELYREHLEHYGPDLPWVDPQPLRPFVDSDFPLWALE